MSIYRVSYTFIECQLHLKSVIFIYRASYPSIECHIHIHINRYLSNNEKDIFVFLSGHVLNHLALEICKYSI